MSTSDVRKPSVRSSGGTSLNGMSRSSSQVISTCDPLYKPDVCSFYNGLERPRLPCTKYTIIGCPSMAKRQARHIDGDWTVPSQLKEKTDTYAVDWDTKHGETMYGASYGNTSKMTDMHRSVPTPKTSSALFQSLVCDGGGVIEKGIIDKYRQQKKHKRKRQTDRPTLGVTATKVTVKGETQSNVLQVHS